MELASFCIPAYNAERFIAFTVQAILNQNYPEFEIIIVDDHSTDETNNIIKKFNDQRIHLVTASNKGAAAARNQALSLAKGKYIIFFDADDWIPSNFLATQISFLKSENEVVVCKWGRFFNNDTSTIEINPQQIEKDLDFKEWIINYWNDNTSMTCPGRVLMTKKLLNKSDKWNEDLALNDDFQFYSALFSHSSIIKFNSLSTFYYRSGIQGLSSTKGDHAYESLYNSLVIGIDIALKLYPTDIYVKKSCANLLMNFVYEAYPKQPNLIKLAINKIKLLGGSNYEFPSGGKTKLLVSLIGWKLTKRLKVVLK